MNEKNKKLLNKRSSAELKKIFESLHPADIADIINSIEEDKVLELFKLIPNKFLDDIIPEINIGRLEWMLEKFSLKEILKIILQLPSDEMADLVNLMSEEKANKVLDLMNKKDSTELKMLLEYKEDTAGGLMATEFISVPDNITVSRAIQIVRKLGKKIDDIYYVYIVNSFGTLIGYTTIKSLILSSPKTLVRSIMNKNVVSIGTNIDQEEVANIAIKYSLNAIPVVDSLHRLIGRVTIDDIVDVINEENTEDIYQLGKMSKGDGEIINYEQDGPFDILKRRIGWLVIFLVFQVFSGTVLKSFEESLKLVVSLTFFIPMILGTGGNAGTQVSITLIRGLATGEVNWSNFWRAIKTEIIAAIVMCLIVGTITFGTSWIFQQSLPVALTIGTSMVVIVMLAISTGIAIPLFAKRVGLDPAVLAGPITTTVVDIIGLIVYFKIAQLLIPGLR